MILKLKFPEITAINTSLLAKEIPCLIISVKKNRKGHIKELHEADLFIKCNRGSEDDPLCRTYR